MQSLSRSDLEQMLKLMDSFGVDGLVFCEWCRQWREALYELPESLKLMYAHPIPRCRPCIERLEEREADRIERLRARDERERAGHFVDLAEAGRFSFDAYDAGLKSRTLDGGPGWVYLGQTNFGTWKIGATRRSVQTRLTSSFACFEHAVWSEHPFALESALHRRFADRRTRAGGEYFKLTGADVEAIKAIQTVGGKAVRHATTLEATRVKVVRE